MMYFFITHAIKKKCKYLTVRRISLGNIREKCAHNFSHEDQLLKQLALNCFCWTGNCHIRLWFRSASGSIGTVRFRFCTSSVKNYGFNPVFGSGLGSVWHTGINSPLTCVMQLVFTIQQFLVSKFFFGGISILFALSIVSCYPGLCGEQTRWEGSSRLG